MKSAFLKRFFLWLIFDFIGIILFLEKAI